MKMLPVHGRGASHNPPNRFQRLSVEREAWTHAEDPSPNTELLRDSSRSVISRNSSPDVPFDAGLNSYRGCSHGCAYCYARPTHEYLGFSAGLDFETKILVKEDAPELLRKELSSPSWEPETILMSGVTDPYQPAERRLEITRRCLEVLAGFRNPVAVITKSHLVTRDVDVLKELAAHDAVFVTLSVTTLRNELHRVMEPRAAILEAAADAGAVRAGYIVLRLPHGVSELFETWLGQHVLDRKGKVLNRLRSLRGEELYDATFGQRMKGRGPFAEQIRSLYRVTTARLGLATEIPPLSTGSFRRPGAVRQTDLFARS